MDTTPTETEPETEHVGYFSDRKGTAYDSKVLTWSGIPDFPAGTVTFATDTATYRQFRGMLIERGFSETS